MKRKHAIRKLSQFLQSKSFVKIGDAEAKTLLDFLEEDIGMRPPYDSSQDDEEDSEEWEAE